MLSDNTFQYIPEYLSKCLFCQQMEWRNRNKFLKTQLLSHFHSQFKSSYLISEHILGLSFVLIRQLAPCIPSPVSIWNFIYEKNCIIFYCLLYLVFISGLKHQHLKTNIQKLKVSTEWHKQGKKTNL